MPQDPQVVLQDPVSGAVLGHLYADSNDDVFLHHAQSGDEIRITSGELDLNNVDLTNADSVGSTSLTVSSSLTDASGTTHTGELADLSDIPTSGERLVDAPNGHIPSALLENGESAEISVPVPDGETLTIYRWGVYKIADSTTPAGLQVQLLDGTDTVQASANTTNTENTSGVASHTNTSGSLSIFKLRADNATGNNYTTDGVGAIFAYEVS